MVLLSTVVTVSGETIVRLEAAVMVWTADEEDSTDWTARSGRAAAEAANRANRVRSRRAMAETGAVLSSVLDRLLRLLLG